MQGAWWRECSQATGGTQVEGRYKLITTVCRYCLAVILFQSYRYSISTMSMGADYIYNRNHDYYGCLPYYVPVDMTLLFYTGRCRNTVATIRTAVLFEARHTYQ